MTTWILLAAVGASIATARPDLAQSSMKDVPAQHWANGAVKELQSRGIITGYPDGTFGGQRAVTRYEFALASQRTLQEVQRRIDASVAVPHPGTTTPLATRQEVNERIQHLQTAVSQLHSDVDDLRRTMTDLQDRAAKMRSEVDQMRQQLGTMRNRVSGIRSQRLFGVGPRP